MSETNEGKEGPNSEQELPFAQTDAHGWRKKEARKEGKERKGWRGGGGKKGNEGGKRRLTSSELDSARERCPSLSPSSQNLI